MKLLNPLHQDIQAIYLTLLSFTGILFLIILYAWAPTSALSYNSLFILIFLIICVLGLLATIFPKSCTRIMNGNISSRESQDGGGMEGHHPPCGKFSNHTITFLGKKLCAGCSGLFIGALLAIILTILYYYNQLGSEDGSLLFLVGLLLVIIALGMIIFINIKKVYLKIASNLLLVLGSLSLFLGVDMVRGDFFIELYVVILILLWIYTRIYFSQKNHHEICGSCAKTSSCPFRF